MGVSLVMTGVCTGLVPKVVIIRLPDLTEYLHFEKADTGRLRSLQYCSENTNTRQLNGSSPFLRSRISFAFSCVEIVLCSRRYTYN